MWLLRSLAIFSTLYIKMSECESMGRLEEAVLLVVWRLDGDGYGVTIRRNLCERLGRDLSFGAVYATLDRLEAKGFVSSRLGDATHERGGKRKRHYRIESAGRCAVVDARREGESLWADLPVGMPA